MGPTDLLRKVHSASTLPSNVILEDAILPLRFTSRPWTLLLLLLLLQCLLLFLFSFPDPTSRSLVSGITEASDISWAPEGGSFALSASANDRSNRGKAATVAIYHLA